MNLFNMLIEFLNTDAGAALAFAAAGWLATYLPMQNRVAIDRAAQIGVHFAEQMKRRGEITGNSDAKAKALEAMQASLPFAVRLMTKPETLARSIEATIGKNNATMPPIAKRKRKAAAIKPEAQS